MKKILIIMLCALALSLVACERSAKVPVPPIGGTVATTTPSSAPADSAPAATLVPTWTPVSTATDIPIMTPTSAPALPSVAIQIYEPAMPVQMVAGQITKFLFASTGAGTTAIQYQFRYGTDFGGTSFDITPGTEFGVKVDKVLDAETVIGRVVAYAKDASDTDQVVGSVNLTATVAPAPAPEAPAAPAVAGNWEVTTFTGVTDQIKGWLNGLKAPDMNWPEPPNADSPSHSFSKANGMVWPNDESHYGQWGSKADLNVPAQHIRVYTGDFSLKGIGECRKVKDTDPGCALVIVNVGSVNAMYRDGMYDYGWTTTGPYFNGDQMVQTLWAVTSHVSYNSLNVAGGTNLGGNCSVAKGCAKVHFFVAVISGNQILGIAQTIVSR